MIKVDKRDAGLWMTPPTVIIAQFIFTFCNGYFCIDFKIISGVKIVMAFLTSFLLPTLIRYLSVILTIFHLANTDAAKYYAASGMGKT